MAKLFDKVLLEAVKQLIALDQKPEVVGEKSVAIARLTLKEMERQGCLKRSNHRKIYQNGKSAKRHGGKYGNWLWWIYPCDTYPDGYSPDDSPYFIQICSKGGDEFITERQTLDEAFSTMEQLKNYHPDGEFRLGLSSLNFRPMNCEY